MTSPVPSPDHYSLNLGFPSFSLCCFNPGLLLSHQAPAEITLKECDQCSFSNELAPNNFQ